MTNSSNFFILGMPRSMTAWLSFLFTHKNVYCHHEGLTSHDISTHKPLSINDYDYVGSCDTNPLMFKHTEDPVVLVYRCLSDVHRSVLRHFSKPQWIGAEEWSLLVRKYLEGYEKEMDCIEGNLLVVDFESLQDKETIINMWEHLLPDVEVPHDWIERVMHYNVGTKNRSLDGAIMETVKITYNTMEKS